jgi:hypothetical protein
MRGPIGTKPKWLEYGTIDPRLRGDDKTVI